MWNRSELKQQAKLDFKRNYWCCVLVSLVIAICLGSSGGSAAGNNSNSNSSYSAEYTDDASSSAASTVLASAITGVVLVLAVVLCVIGIFVFNPLLVGGRRFYLDNQYSSGQLNRLGFAFKNGYVNVALTMFMKSLFTFLWALLLVIPGIVKSYSYWMMEYMLAENPTLDRSRAFDISKQTMKGQKWNVFVLDLSFILWGILSAITCGIVGIFYVMPYTDATKARLYAVLRENALQSGIATPEELPGYF